MLPPLHFSSFYSIIFHTILSFQWIPAVLPMHRIFLSTCWWNIKPLIHRLEVFRCKNSPTYCSIAAAAKKLKHMNFIVAFHRGDRQLFMYEMDFQCWCVNLVWKGSKQRWTQVLEKKQTPDLFDMKCHLFPPTALFLFICCSFSAGCEDEAHFVPCAGVILWVHINFLC